MCRCTRNTASTVSNVMFRLGICLTVLYVDLRYDYQGGNINERQHRCSLSEFIKVVLANQAGKTPQRVLNMLDIPLSSRDSRTMYVTRSRSRIH